MKTPVGPDLLLGLVAILLIGIHAVSVVSCTEARLGSSQGQDCTIVSCDAAQDADAAPDLNLEMPRTDVTAPNTGFGELCERDAECESGYCINVDSEGEGTCTQLCRDDCPDGYSCRLLETAGPDAVRLCIPERPILCTACEGHAECGGFSDLCLTQDNGRFCSTDCSEDRQCASGFLCNPQEVPNDVGGTDTFWQCEPQDGTCPEPGDTNDCGGFAPLDEPLGTECGPCGGGEWVCNGLNDVRCDGPEPTNGCGGCDALEHDLDEVCGTCDSGTWQCADDNSTSCTGDRGEDAENECGGCADLGEEVGTPCGECPDGVWACTDSGGQFCTCTPCDDLCFDAESTRCFDGANQQTCSDYNRDGCLEWGDDLACRTGSCVGTLCEDCDNDCDRSGDTRCATGSRQQFCGSYDADSCPEWGGDTECRSGLCSGSACVVCSDECVDGRTRCLDGTRVQRCGDYDDDTCLEWGGTASCRSGICEADDCVECRDDCSVPSTQCLDGTRQQVCGDYDRDTCSEWGGTTSCASGLCRGDACVICRNECTRDAVQCASGSSIESCDDDHDSDTCLEWGGESSCRSGYCENDACTYCGDGACNGAETPATCSDDCSVRFVAQERLGRRTAGDCDSLDYGWHLSQGSVYWTFGTSCAPPSTSTPWTYSQEYGRWRFEIRKAGRYQIRVKIPPQSWACDFATSKYTTGATYILDRPGSNNLSASLDQRDNIDSEATVFSDVRLGTGEAALYLYDSVSDLSSCCDTCGQSIRVFFDYAVFEWVGL